MYCPLARTIQSLRRWRTSLFLPSVTFVSVSIGLHEYHFYNSPTTKAGWMVFWMRENFWASQALVIINSSAQLYAVYYLLAPSSAFRVTAQNWQTHVVAKMSAGIGVLDLIDNGGVALVSRICDTEMGALLMHTSKRYPGPPSIIVQASTVVAFLALVSSQWLLHDSARLAHVFRQ